jgi:hypothetical protein
MSFAVMSFAVMKFVTSEPQEASSLAAKERHHQR